MDLVQTILFSLLAGLAVVLVIFFVQTSDFFSSSSKSKSKTPAFLIVGSNNSGKTSLYYSLLKQQHPTVSSLEPNESLISLPFASAAIAQKFRLVDFPGHLKYTSLLHKLIQEDIGLKNLKGVVFVIDSSSTAINQEDNIKNMCKVLFDLISETEKMPNGVDYLFAVNKQDLFESLPIHRIRTIMEKELGGLVTSEINRSGVGIDEDEEKSSQFETKKQLWSIIMQSTNGEFKFELLEGNMDFIGGSVLKNKTDNWENWFDERVVNYGGM